MAKAAGYEADDFLAATVAAEERADGSALVASGDRDSFQLASSRTTILNPSRGGEIARIGPEEVRARYGVDPNQVPDYCASRRPFWQIAWGCRSRAQTRRSIAATVRRTRWGLFQTQAEMLGLYRLIDARPLAMSAVLLIRPQPDPLGGMPEVVARAAVSQPHSLFGDEERGRNTPEQSVALGATPPTAAPTGPPTTAPATAPPAAPVRTPPPSARTSVGRAAIARTENPIIIPRIIFAPCWDDGEL
jgi:hypothetical protein